MREKPVLKLEEEEVAGVEFQETPKYYQRTLGNGKPIVDIAPTIEWGYLLYLTVFRICQYFGSQQECQFCRHQQKLPSAEEERSALHGRQDR